MRFSHSSVSFAFASSVVFTGGLAAGIGVSSMALLATLAYPYGLSINRGWWRSWAFTRLQPGSRPEEGARS